MVCCGRDYNRLWCSHGGRSGNRTLNFRNDLTTGNGVGRLQVPGFSTQVVNRPTNPHQRLIDDLVHVEILISSAAADEGHVSDSLCERPVRVMGAVVTPVAGVDR